MRGTSFSREVGGVMTNPNEHEIDKPVLESEMPRVVYQRPKLTRLDLDIATGGVNVPETNVGLLES